MADKPWIFRTYAGHSTASESNKLYKGNLAKGQTGLSIAFDLPTQTGYDPDDPHARGDARGAGPAELRPGEIGAFGVGEEGRQANQCGGDQRAGHLLLRGVRCEARNGAHEIFARKPIETRVAAIAA